MVLHLHEHLLYIGQAQLAVVMLPSGVELAGYDSIGFDAGPARGVEGAHLGNEGSGDFRG